MSTEPSIISQKDLRDAQLKMLKILVEIDRICRKYSIGYWLDGGTLLGAVRHQGFIPWDDDIDIGMMRDDYEKFLQVAPKEFSKDIFLQKVGEDEGFINLIVPVKVRDQNSFILEGFESGDEPYHHGLFVDIFAYDYLPSGKTKRDFCKYIAKKIMKFKRYKIEKHKEHHGDLIYKILNPFISLKTLNEFINKIIHRSNRKNSKIIGFGYDSTLKRIYEAEKFFELGELDFEGYKFFVPKDYDYYLRTTYGDYMKLPPLEEQRPLHIKKLVIDVKATN